MARSILAAVMVLFLVGVCKAGWLDDAIKSTGESVGRRAVGMPGTARTKARRARQRMRSRGRASPVKTSPPPGPHKGPERHRIEVVRGKVAKADSEPGTGGVSIEQAEAVFSKYDFIPGDKMIFFDDSATRTSASSPGSGRFPAPRREQQRGGGRRVPGETVFTEQPGGQGQAAVRIDPIHPPEPERQSAGEVHRRIRRRIREAVFHRPAEPLLSPVAEQQDGWLQNNAAAMRSVPTVRRGKRIRNSRTPVEKVDGKVHHVASASTAPS